MSEILTKANIEALKEVGRLVAIAAVPILIDALPAFELSPQIIALVIAILRFIDKALHEYGNLTENEQLKAGLTRF